jgi:hypothetical protein|tara:strand:+ start:344 stop:949 length:606 start_codon:yes stop_codon:yes gene_type:complete
MKIRIMRAIGNFILGVLAISTWYGCEVGTTNHQKCLIFGDTRVITDTIYLHDNGRHVDIIMPRGDTYIGYGWGSKTFYLDVPTWSDLTFRACFNAVDKENETLMHVKRNLVKMEDWVAIPITKYQWNDLSKNITKSFKLDSNAARVVVADGYGSSDLFYEANGEYGWYYTCNTWANEMLKNSGIYARKHAIFSKEVIDIHR